MGRDKAWLKLGDQTLTERMISLLAPVVDVVVVVGRSDQELPELPSAVERVDDDPRWGEGPLVGLAAGLRRLAELDVELAFCCSVDGVFLDRAHVEWALVQARDGAWLPETETDGRRVPHPLAGALPVKPAAARAPELLAVGERSAKALYAALGATRSARVPDASALRGCNTEADWVAARRELGGL